MIIALLHFPALPKGFAVHQLFAAFFTVLLSFCHHSASARPMEASNSYNALRPSPTFSFPARQELARTTSDTGYAGPACLSCGTMSVSFTAR